MRADPDLNQERSQAHALLDMLPADKLNAVRSLVEAWIVRGVDRYLTNRTGDVKKLQAAASGLCLRCDNHRVFFDLTGENTVAVTAIRNRREAYR